MGTLYYTGMRRSQLLGLQWGDVDFANQTITLRAETSKNRRQFIVPLPVKIYQLLLAVRAKMLGAGDSYVDGGAPVFNWGLFAPTARARKLEKLTEWQLQRFFTSLRGALGIEISAHRLRHSAGTELMALTRNPKLVQQMLCHTNIQSTMIYVQPEVAEMRELADRR